MTVTAPAVSANPKGAHARTAPKKTKPRRPAAKRAPATPTGQEAERLYQFYSEMLDIRRFEERAGRAYTQALVGGYCHLNLGEEAAIVGLCAAMESTDYLFTNYREHGYALARGIPAGEVMAELYGRVDGVSRGWGGSMHMFDLTHRLLGGYAIVGGQLPLATGAALAIDYRGGKEAVVATMGDGTTNIGAFHESLNLAAIWQLPVVFVVINNGLGMGTVVDASSAEPELYKRARAYKMPSARVDGLDPEQVYQAMSTALASARAGKPYLLEVVTVRLRGHSVVDPAKYRSAEQVKAVKAADPIPALAQRLLDAGIADQAQLDAADARAKQMAQDADAFAQASPLPDPATLFDYDYATPVNGDLHRLPGQPLFPLALGKGGGR
jgi:pyruvate dehydrogenase E1 component alpha subunit